MQFYASFALHLKQDKPRRPSNVSKPALDIKSSAFSTPEEEERWGKRVSYGWVYISYCTRAAQRKSAGTGRAEQMQNWAKKYHTQTVDVNLNNLWNVNVAFFFH